MELKYIKFTAKTYGVVSSNRTFMELKFCLHDDDGRDEVF